MIVTRGDVSFDVVDDPQTAAWRFWEDQFATGEWEPFTLDAIDQHLSGGVYVDVGAWVGPTVLWAARHGGHVVAVEPDPVARAVLTENVTRNGADVQILPCAVAVERGRATLHGIEWGDSQSSLLAVATATVEVDTLTFAEILPSGPVDLVKIDIEGAEADVFPAATDLLHDLGCPVLLSLHLDWITDPDPLLDAIDGWDSTIIDDTNPAFRTLLLR